MVSALAVDDSANEESAGPELPPRLYFTNELIDEFKEEMKMGTVELAITGAAYVNLGPEEVDDLWPYFRVFARMEPAQKTKAVIMYRN